MLQDLRFALRLLVKQPGFTLVAVLALGLGIGLATAVFNTYSAVLLRPLPHLRDEHRLVFINSVPLNQPDDFDGLSMPDLVDLRARARTIEGLTTVQEKTMILAGVGAAAGTPERVLGADISVEGFPMLGVQPVLGRVFTSDESALSAPPVAIVSHALWQKRYGGSDDVIGRVEIINGVAATIVGVLPAGFGFPENTALWMPLRAAYQEKDRSDDDWSAWARLRDGVTLDEAQTEIAGIAAALAQERPATNRNRGFATRLVRDEATENERGFLKLMLGGAISVLLIACANVANLLLARATGRTHEIAVRISIGATRARIFRQMLTECLLLGLLGGAAGLLVATWANGLMVAAIPNVEIPFWIQFDFDWRVFLFATLAALVASLTFGLFPALQASKQSAHDLKEGPRTATGSRRTRTLRHALVVSQIALSTVLLIAAGLFIRSFLKMHGQPLGFDPQGVLTFRVGLPSGQFDEAEVNRFFAELSPRLAATPGVIAAGAVSFLPGNGNNDEEFILGDRPAPATLAEAPRATERFVSPDYFEALRIPLVQGRLFNATDTRNSPGVCLVDQQFVQRWFGGQDPLGQRVRLSFDADDDAGWFTIVGVVGNVAQELHAPVTRGSIYRSIDQITVNFLSYAVRVQGDPATFGPALQRAVREVRPDIPIYQVLTLEHSLALAHWHQSFFVQVFTAFGLGALLLAAIGVYSVMSYTVAQRTTEIGVRMALGASAADVLRLVGGQGLLLVGAGLALGLVTAFGASQLLTSFLFGISPDDPLTYLVLTTVLAAVGGLACWLPARRATQVDPALTLRSE